jgi:hypothetical protein
MASTSVQIQETQVRVHSGNNLSRLDNPYMTYKLVSREAKA